MSSTAINAPSIVPRTPIHSLKINFLLIAIGHSYLVRINRRFGFFENSLQEELRTQGMSETIPDPEENRPEEEDEETTGATSSPLADPPGSRGHKARNPYEGTEADDTPGPSWAEQMEDDTPAADEELEGGEER
jgi:hypothetical protein